MSLRERLNSVPAFTSEVIDVEEWGEKISIRSMSIAEKMKVTKAASNGDDIELDRMLPAVLIATCFDPVSGEKVFSDEDTEWIQTQSAGVVEKIAAAGIRISGMTDDAFDKGKAGS